MYIEYCYSVGSFGAKCLFIFDTFVFLIRMNLSFIRFTRCYNFYLCWSIMNNRKNLTASKNWGAAKKLSCSSPLSDASPNLTPNLLL